MLESQSRMNFEEMQKVLKYLPEPSYICVDVGNFDLSHVQGEAQTFTKGLILEGLEGRLESRIKDPSKEKLLQIYKNQNSRDELDFRFVSFSEAGWLLPQTRIIVTPWNVRVICTDKVPDYVEKMKEEIKETSVDYEIIQKRYMA